MDCKEFLELINDFCNDDLKPKYYHDFIMHSKKCPECMDELRINYMIKVGLDKLDNDASKSFNITYELDEQLDLYKNRSDIIYRHKIYGWITFIVSELCAVAMFIYRFILLKDGL
ncbi:hypothetical protein SAMN02910289_00715 [Lachnospiraceae bacterium RM5]|nr:hypothetical protein SAMN02910289_00715 [Lachnospiraceae bacterium RM5]